MAYCTSDISKYLFAQCLRKVVCCKPKLLELLGVELTVANDNNRIALHYRAEFNAFHTYEGYEHFKSGEYKNRYKSVDERNFRVLHRYYYYLRQKYGNYKLGRLQFSYLTFSENTHCKNYQNVEYQSAKQSYQHNFTHTYVVPYLPNINFSFGNNINGDKNEQVV